MEPSVIRSAGQARAVRAVGVVALVITLALAGGIATLPDRGAVVGGVVCAVIAVIGSLFIFVRIARAGLVVDDNGLRVRGAVSERRMAWSEVAEVRLESVDPSQLSGFLVGRDGSRIRITGIQALTKAGVREMRARLEEVNREIARRQAT